MHESHGNNKQVCNEVQQSSIKNTALNIGEDSLVMSNYWGGHVPLSIFGGYRPGHTKDYSLKNISSVFGNTMKVNGV